MKLTLTIGDVTDPSREIEFEFINYAPPLPAVGEHIGVEFSPKGDQENFVVSHIHKQYSHESISISIGVVSAPTSY